MKESKMCEVLILGGGISGLAAAQSAEKSGLDYILVDKGPTFGGLSRSVYIDDYTFDYTGHFLHLSKLKSPSQISEHISQNDWEVVQKKSKCYFEGDLIDAPFQHNLGQLKKPTGDDLYFQFKERSIEQGQPRNLKEYFVQKFGQGISKSFLVPYNEKLLDVNLESLDVNAITRFFPAPDPSEIENGYSGNNVAKAYNSSFWYPKAGGMQKLIDGMAKEIPRDKTQSNSKVLSINLKRRIVETESAVIAYGQAISSIPLNQLSAMSGILGIGDASALSAASTTVFNIGVRGHLSDEFRGIHWIYFSEHKYPFYRVGFYSNICPKVAPIDGYSIYVEISGLWDFEKQQALLSRSITALEEIGIIIRSRSEVVSKNEIPISYVHYTHRRENVVNRLTQVFAEGGIKMIGRYGKWQYSSMEDSILEGRTSLNK